MSIAPLADRCLLLNTGPFITRTISTTELREELEDLIRRVQAGEDVTAQETEEHLVVNPRFDDGHDY